MRVHQKRRIKRLLDHWFCMMDYIGFIDASWKLKNESILAGIGGFLVSKDGDIKFIFSGPAVQASVFDTELEALHFLLNSYRQSDVKHNKLAVFSDSSKLVHHFNACKLSDFGLLSKWITKVRLVFVERSINYIADQLSKEGKDGNYMLSSWF